MKDNDDAPMSFWEHLDVLRKYIIRILICTGVIFLLIFCLKDTVFDIILAPQNNNFITYKLISYITQLLGIDYNQHINFNVQLINTGLAGQFVIHMQVALCIAAVLTSPYILYAVFQFISPALYSNERKYLFKIMPASFLMFALGIILCYFILFPFTFRFLGTYHISDNVENMISLQSYINTLLIMSFMMGILFELPIICWLLAKMNLINAHQMRHFRRHAIVAILIISAVITPTSDVFTLSLVSIPIYLLYECSILIVARNNKKAQVTQS